MRVTIVPEDKYIQVDGRGLNFDFPANPNIHAIQWYEDHGRVEQKVGGTRQTTIEEVQYFVDLWEQERVKVDTPPPVEPDSPEKIMKRKKVERQKAVETLVVTTESGKQFDGNEVAQDRMARAILALDPLEETIWILADNTVDRHVSREELREALRLSGAAQTAIWAIPYYP